MTTPEQFAYHSPLPAPHSPLPTPRSCAKLLLSAMALLAACGRPDLPVTASPPDDADMHVTVASLVSCTATFSYYCAFWSSNQAVYAYAVAPSNRSALSAAITRWSDALTKYGSAYVPALVYTQDDSVTHHVVVVGASSGSTFCGATNENASPVTITLSADGSCSTNHGSMVDVLGHELGHAYGWLGPYPDVPKPEKIGKSDHCAQVLPADGSIKTAICAHMIEGARAAYTSLSFDADSFWATEFVVGPSYTLSPDTVEVGSSVQLNPGPWELDRGGSTPGGYTWSSSNSSIASVSGGLVTGVATGTAMIHLFPTSSSTYYQSYRFKTGGFTVPITVVPQSPIPLVVTDIGRPGPDSLEPIHTPGNYLLTGLIQPGDTTGASYRWVLKFSDAPNDSTVSGWGPRTHTMTIPSPIGSYTVTAGVYVMRHDTIGPVYTRRDVTVCPASQEEYLRLATPTPPTTDAVYNCEP